MTQERKRAQFTELDEAKKKIISKRCFQATLAANFRGSVLKEKFDFASSQFILDKAKYYAENYASAQEKLQYIQAKNEYETLAKSNGIYYREDTKYQQYITTISKIEDMEELDKYIKGGNPSGKEIPIHSLNSAVSDRERALGDKDGLYSSVKEKLLAYGKYKYEKRQKKNQDQSKLTLEENKLISKLTLQDFLDSEFIYKQDYCKEKKLSVNTFDKRVSNVKEYDGDFFENYQKHLEEKRINYYKSLKPVVVDILDNISQNNGYDIIDYYLSYKDLYTFEDLCKCCNLYKMDIRVLKTFLSKADVKSSLNYDSFLSQSYTANGHEYSQSEKEEIYNFSKENLIPFNWQNVSLLVKKGLPKQISSQRKSA